MVDLIHKPNDRWINRAEFCKRFNRQVRDENGELIVETKLIFFDDDGPNVANVVIIKKSRHKIVVTFKYDDKYFFYEGDANLSPMYSEEGDYHVRTIHPESTTGCRISFDFLLNAIEPLAFTPEGFKKIKKTLSLKIGKVVETEQPLIIQPGPGYFNNINELIKLLNNKLDDHAKIEVAHHKISVSRPAHSEIKV